MLVYIAIVVTLNFILTLWLILVTTVGLRKSLKDFAAEMNDAKVERGAGVPEKEAEAERKMDEGFQNIMSYGGSLAEFMSRKDE